MQMPDGTADKHAQCKGRTSSSSKRTRQSSYRASSISWNIFRTCDRADKTGGQLHGRVHEATRRRVRCRACE